MNQVLQYIEEHLEEPLSNKQLADVAGYSEYYFIRLFKTYTNETVMEYVCRRRLIKACEDFMAGMFCDVTVKGNAANLENDLPTKVWNIVKQLDKQEADEVVLIKLAERLHNMLISNTCSKLLFWLFADK